MSGFTVLGEVVVDRIHAKNEIHDIPGGSAANCALALSRIKPNVKFMARFSEDKFGEMLYQAALKNNLDVSDAVRAAQPATLVDVIVTETGSPTYEFHLSGTADWQWQEIELTKHDLTKQRAFIYGSLAAILDPGYRELQKWLAPKKQTDLLIAYDPNARPSAIAAADAQAMRLRILENVQNATVVKVSDEDLAWIAPSKDPLTEASKWSLLGPELVVVTRGANGASAFRKGICIANIPGFRTQVVDTVGAGDTLMAWLVAGLVDVSVPQRFNAGVIENILRKAVRAAAITCSRTGCNPPTVAEVN